MTPHHPMVVAVMAIVAAAYGVDVDMLWKPKRARSFPTIDEARQLVAWVLKHRMCWSYPEVGRALALDHTTIIHACKRTQSRLDGGPVTPAFHLALRALSLEELHALLPDLSTVRSTVITGMRTVASPSPTPPPSDNTVQVFSSSADSSPISSGSEEPVSKPARAKRNRPRTAVPDQLLPTDKHREIATDKGLDLKLEVERFLNHHRAKGSLMASWNAALNTWLLSPYAQPVQSRSNGKPPGLIEHERHRAEEERSPAPYNQRWLDR